MTNQLMAKRWAAVMMDNYGTPQLALASGQGCRVTDVEGTSYLDFVAGIAVSALGHAHPAVVAAVTEQAGRLMHTSNLVSHEPGVRLAEKLQFLVGDPSARVFFANDGAAANECAVKLSRLYGRSLDPSGNRLGLVSTANSFHGRTLGALAVTGNPAKRQPFEPLPGPVTFVDYGDVEALRAAVDDGVAAVFLEPTQGEGGVLPAPQGYLAAAREICDRTGALLVVDEVQSGIGRTGQWFASIAAGVVPDILTLAKGLGGGLPIGACIGFGKAAGLFAPGSHGSTFGGNPVSCAAALAVLETIEQQDLLAQVRRCGAALAAGLHGLDSPLVEQVRGSGLWYGVQLSSDCAAQVELAARERGLLVNSVRPDVLRLAPPLIVTEVEIAEALQLLGAALQAVQAEQADQAGQAGASG
ncbi:acetylornithine transaminase [Jatrophihabitans sp.]|uniref:acetylornithine transaminase n=1 Tax=Jatrophihabitans sp. TaxID=1932789 RepID=UPI002BC413AC|nr:acetylornithine transaminase [Jatrophihabitans sp.]